MRNYKDIDDSERVPKPDIGSVHGAFEIIFNGVKERMAVEKLIEKKIGRYLRAFKFYWGGI